jgi:hypothetical protein
MADRVIQILTPAATYDLLSLDELKLRVGIPSTDTSQDAVLQDYITRFSDMVATTCNRVFAYEKVSEIWQCTNYDDSNSMKRLFVSHWPIDTSSGNEPTVESPTGSVLDPSTYAIEQRSGKIELLGINSEPITVTYSGGYVLPDAAPPALKEATELMIREAQAIYARLQSSGIRSLVHKEARVMFFDPLALLAKGGIGGFATTAANALLMHYTRLEV